MSDSALGGTAKPYIQKPWRALKPDAQAFDEIRIVTVPRFKESGLSGDEWRISANIQFWRKGKVVHETKWGRNIEAAIMGLGAQWQEACDNAKGFFAGEGDTCDQEGCAQTATVAYRLRKGFHNDGSERPLQYSEYRRFCDKHKHRGDCSLEDSDGNYEAVEL